jgi:2-phospho-L-lactate guanylyltransferase
MICIIIPVKRLEFAKSRLSEILSKEQRVELSIYLLEDLLSVIKACNIFDIIIIGYDQSIESMASSFNIIFIHERGEGVNNAIRLADKYMDRFEASIVIPIDLPLLEPIDLMIIKDISNSIKNGIIITPSYRLDGTNLLLRKPPLVMETYYDMDSYLLHIQKAREKGLEVKILLNERIMHDLDSIEDINYLLNTKSNKKSILYLKDIMAKNIK